MKKSMRRGAGALCVALAATAAIGSTAVSSSAASPEAEYAGSALGVYLAANDDHLSSTFGSDTYPDYGLTLDAVLALDAAGVDSTESDAALGYVEDNLSSYIGNGTTEKYAGASAKALVASLANGGDGTLGGVDLVARVQGLEKSTGRFSDVSQYGDYSNLFGQTFAMVGLQRAGETLTKASKTFLRAQQCPNGGFRITLNKVACTNNAQVDNDATAIGLQALLTLPESATRTTLVNKAAAYLKTQQRTNGGIVGGPDHKPNANTTGLAAASLRASGKNGMADKAVAYLKALQLDCGDDAAIRGLVAYDTAAFNAAQGTTASTEQQRRSTTQAALGLAGVSYAEVTSEGAGTVPVQQPCA